MYISNIKLWDFRKFGGEGDFNSDNLPNLYLNFTKGLNVIIGENDSGKSAIIDAIKLVLKTHSYEYIKIEHSDFYNKSNRFRIEIRFENLSPNEAKNFTEWLGWTGTGEKAEPYLKVTLDVSKQGDRILPSDVRAGVDEDGYQLTAEAREYLKATYLKPLRDAENELIAKKNSRLSQILIGDEAFKGKEKDHELVVIFNEFNDNLKKYFKGELNENQEGKLIKDKIDGYIQQFYSKNHETEFETAKGEIKSILEKLTLTLKDEPNPGLGTLNRLCMAAELLHLGKENWTGIRLGLIEELEAHLHPQAQMQVIETLQNLDTIQLILTTHSPNLASKLKLENLIICNNSNAFPMGSSYTKLDPDDYKFLEKFLDTTKANLFFAKGVILVEGWAEEILIPSIAKNIGINLTEKGVSIVNIGNIGFVNYSKIFIRKDKQLMSIPVSIITDVDIREYKKKTKVDTEGKIVKDADGKSEYIYEKRDSLTITSETAAKKLKIIKELKEQKIDVFVAPNWTLEYCLYKSSSISTSFKSVVKSIHSGTDWDTDFEKTLAEKLINKGLKKSEIAYRIANAIDEDLKAVENKKKQTKDIIINPDDGNDSINYLVKAIKYASGN